MAATSHVATEGDERVAQFKTWSSMELYATQVNVSARSKEVQRALEQLEETPKLVDGRYEVGLPRAGENATIFNTITSQRIRNSVHWNDVRRRTNPSSKCTRRLSMLTCRITIIVN